MPWGAEKNIVIRRYAPGRRFCGGLLGGDILGLDIACVDLTLRLFRMNVLNLSNISHEDISVKLRLREKGLRKRTQD